jgi:hypothetical protein
MRGSQLLGSPSITPRLPVKLRSSRSCAQEPSIDEVQSIDRQPAVADRLQIRTRSRPLFAAHRAACERAMLDRKGRPTFVSGRQLWR